MQILDTTIAAKGDAKATDIACAANNQRHGLDVSILITAHCEGIIAHKTILSVLKSAEGLNALGLTWEIIVGLDNPDDITRAYYQRWQTDSRFTVLASSFGNPAENRNNCVQCSRGDYIAILDGDDMISANWLPQAFVTLKQNESAAGQAGNGDLPATGQISAGESLAAGREDTSETPAAGQIIVHPNGHFHFDVIQEQFALWLMSDSFSFEEDALLLSYWNRWNVVAFAHRSVFERFPYAIAKDGWGPEDYFFNVQTRAAGIRHIIAPQTMMFYRQMQASTSRLHQAANVILPYSPLFDIEFFHTIPAQSPQKNKKLKGRIGSILRLFAKSIYRLGVDILKHLPGLKSKLTPHFAKLLYNRRIKAIPDFVLSALREINHIDNSLYPNDKLVLALQYHPLTFDQRDATSGMGWYYHRLVSHLSGSIDYVFLAPQLMVGGTEKLIENYARAIAITHPNWTIAIITSQPTYNRYTPPNGVIHIPFGDITDGLSLNNIDLLTSRLLVQMQVKNLHVINDENWYGWISRHTMFLAKNNYKVYASLFMRDWAKDSNWQKSFADPWLVLANPALTRVFTDNQTIIKQTLLNNAIPEDKFVVHYQPEESVPQAPKNIDTNKPLRVLWASRLSYQKRLDILKSIAQALNPNEFLIDVYGREQEYKPSYLRGIKSLSYKGSFSGIHSLPLADYDVFLYTSSTDGMPNIVLEIAAAGLPIVASASGGVGEFIINGQTGYLVDIDDINGYLQALTNIRARPDEATKMAREAQQLLVSRHSFKLFCEQIGKDII